MKFVSISIMACVLTSTPTLLAQTSAPAEGPQPEMAADDEPVKLRPSEIGVLGLPAAPLEGTIATDRPDFTESAETVPWGRVQLEMGYTFTQEKGARLSYREHTMPEFLLRIGIVERFELRFVWAGYSYVNTREKQTIREDDGGYRTLTTTDWS